MDKIYEKLGGKIFLWLQEIAHKNKTSNLPKPSVSVSTWEEVGELLAVKSKTAKVQRSSSDVSRQSESCTWYSQGFWLTEYRWVSRAHGVCWGTRNNVASIVTFKSGLERCCLGETHFEYILLGTKAKWVSQSRRTERREERPWTGEKGDTPREREQASCHVCVHHRDTGEGPTGIRRHLTRSLLYSFRGGNFI